MTAVNSDLASLLELVVCPSCRSRLVAESDTLGCTGCGRTFRLDGRVPVFLSNGGSERPESRVVRLQHAILGNPRLYDFHQAHGGGRQIAAQVERALSGFGGGTLLDIGAGTGMLAGLVPPEVSYVWLDNDRLKLQGLVAKSIDCLAVLGDAARLPFEDGAADWTAMVEVSHHLPDDALHACLDEVARVTRDRFVFVDALRGRRVRSKLLWQLDLGAFPRTESALLRALEARFELESVVRFRINHDHLLCVCVPHARER